MDVPKVRIMNAGISEYFTGFPRTEAKEADRVKVGKKK